MSFLRLQKIRNFPSRNLQPARTPISVGFLYMVVSMASVALAKCARQQCSVLTSFERFDAIVPVPLREDSQPGRSPRNPVDALECPEQRLAPETHSQSRALLSLPRRPNTQRWLERRFRYERFGVGRARLLPARRPGARPGDRRRWRVGVSGAAQALVPSYLAMKSRVAATLGSAWVAAT